MIVLLSRLYELLYASEAIASYEYTVKATTISRQGAMLAPIRLTNEARAASASHSGETQGDASPPPVPTTPAPTRLFYYCDSIARATISGISSVCTLSFASTALMPSPNMVIHNG